MAADYSDDIVLLAQWHEVIRLTGRLAEAEVDQVDADTRRQLMSAFRRHHGD